jgi:hypothetical protein
VNGSGVRAGGFSRRSYFRFPVLWSYDFPMDPAAPATAPMPLDYGLRRPIHRRPVIRRAIIAVVLTFAVILGVEEIKAAWPSVRLYYLERQCLAHPVAPNTLVYSSGSPPLAIQSPQLDQFELLASPNGPYLMVPWRAQLRIFEVSPETYNSVSTRATASVYVGTRHASNGVTRFLGIKAHVF